MTVRAQIENIIKSKGRGSYVFASDFETLADNATIRQTLRRIENDGIILKESRGIWIYPVIETKDDYDTVISIENTLKAKADKIGVTVVKFPHELFKSLGLEESEDTKSTVFFSPTSTRKFTIGERTVIIKHSSDARLFNFKNEKYRNVYILIKTIGLCNLSEENISSIREYLIDVSPEMVSHDWNLLSPVVREQLKQRFSCYIDPYLLEIESLCEQYFVKSLYVFGSVLTSRFNENSDIDFAVTFHKEQIKSYAENYFDLKDALSELLCREIDLVVLESVHNIFFKEELDSKKKLIYAN